MTSNVRWTVSARSSGEVLAVRVQRPGGLELAFLGAPTGFDASEVETWLAELAGVADEAARASESEVEQAPAGPIPRELHQALSGLLFYQAELWKEREGRAPCAVALLTAGDRAAFGWTGDGQVELLVAGRRVESAWILVRDDQGRTARAFIGAARMPLAVRAEWVLTPGDAGSAGAVLEAEWSDLPEVTLTEVRAEPAADDVETPAPTVALSALDPGSAGVESPPRGPDRPPGAWHFLGWMDRLVGERGEPTEKATPPAPAPAGSTPVSEPVARDFSVASDHATPAAAGAWERADDTVTIEPSAEETIPADEVVRVEPFAEEMVPADDVVTIEPFAEEAADDVVTIEPFAEETIRADEVVRVEPFAEETIEPGQALPIEPYAEEMVGAARPADGSASERPPVFERTTPGSALRGSETGDRFNAAAAQGPSPTAIPALPGHAPEHVEPGAPVISGSVLELTGSVAPLLPEAAIALPPAAGSAAPATPHSSTEGPAGPAESETSAERAVGTGPVDFESLAELLPEMGVDKAGLGPPPDPVLGPVASAIAQPTGAVAGPPALVAATAAREQEPGIAAEPEAAPAPAAAEEPLTSARRVVRRPPWPDPEEDSSDGVRPLWSRPWFVAAVILGLFGAGWLLGRVDLSRGGRGAGVLLRAIGLGPAHYELAVTSRPAGAWISVDGVDQSLRTPASLSLKPGPHQIVLSTSGAGGSSYAVHGKRGERAALDVELWGTLAISTPAGGVPIAVTVDGLPRGIAPLSVDRLPPGVHRVQFSGPGVAPWEQAIEVQVNRTAELLAQPIASPATGLLVVRARLASDSGSDSFSGALVWIDGEMRGTTPLKLELPRGPHSIRVRFQNTDAPVQVIDLPGGNQRFADFEIGLDDDRPGLQAALPEQIPLDRPTVLSASIARARPGEVRDMWLHVRTPEGAWRGYSMTVMKASDGLVGVVVFPTALFDARGRTSWYVSATTPMGDEYFTEIQTARSASKP
jgi:hypothetical protein